MEKSPYFKGISLFFCRIFKVFSLNHVIFPNTSPMEIVTAFEAYTAWLKKSVENGHFHACSPMKFSNGYKYIMSEDWQLFLTARRKIHVYKMRVQLEKPNFLIKSLTYAYGMNLLFAVQTLLHRSWTKDMKLNQRLEIFHKSDTVMSLSFRTNRSGQKMQIQIRLLLKGSLIS